MNKRIVLCADDYGQALEITQGILNLLERERISAVSCLTNSPRWPEDAKKLWPYLNKTDIGLHFNLTWGKALSPQFSQVYGSQFPKISALMSRAFLRQLDSAVIEEECNAQLDAFINEFDHYPRFIDGHQHIHQFPVIRKAVISVYLKRLYPKHAYVRLLTLPVKRRDPYFDFKKSILYMTGSKALQKLLRWYSIPHNHSFAGIYVFSKSNQYDRLFEKFLQQVDDGGLIMCHPGLQASSHEDPIAQARYDEYKYFSSDKFLEDCERAKVLIRPFFDIFLPRS